MSVDYGAWLKSDTAIRCVLVEAVANVSGVETTFYLSNTGYIDGVANREYKGVIQGSLTTTESLSLDGQGSMAWGGIEIDNTNGERDAWLGYVWDNRSIKIYFGDITWAKADFQQVFSGIIDKFTVISRNALGIAIKDKLQQLNTPITDTKLGGSTANANELIPLTFGEVFNITPLLIDPALHKYQVHNGQIEAVIEVRDDGVPITSYTANLTTGIITLTAAPAGQITCDVQGDKPAGVYTNKIGAIIRRIVTAFGKVSTRFTDSDIDLTNFSVFDAAHPAAVGIYLNSRENVLNVIQRLVDSIGAQVLMNRSGLLSLYQISLPATGAARDVNTTDIVVDSFNVSQNLPVVTSVKTGFCQNWTVQGSLQSGVVTNGKNILGREFFTSIGADTETATLYKQDVEPVQKDTLLIATSDATTESARRLALYLSPRSVVSFTGFSSLFDVELGQIVNIIYPRFGLDAGKSGIVLGLRPDWLGGRVEIDVLGFEDAISPATYSITPNVSNVNEGSAVVFDIVTTQVPDSTTIFWRAEGTNVTTGDFTDNAVSGSFAITGNAYTLTRTLKNDIKDEGTESFQITLSLTEGGSGVATSAAVTVNDTSMLLPSVPNLITLGSLGSSYWTLYSFNVNTTINFAIAPDGTNTAAKVYAASTNYTLQYAFHTASGIGGDGKITFRIFVKQGVDTPGYADYGKASFLFRNQSTGTNICGVQVTFSTGTWINFFGTTYPFTADDVGDGWWRLTITVTGGVSNGNLLYLYAGFCGEPRASGDYMLMWIG